MRLCSTAQVRKIARRLVRRKDRTPRLSNRIARRPLPRAQTNQRAPLVITAAGASEEFAGAVLVIGQAEQAGVAIGRHAHGGNMIWPGRALPSGRVMQEVALATSAPMPVSLTALLKGTSLDQHASLDVEVAFE